MTTIDDISGRLFATVQETADLTGYDRRTIRKAIEAKTIPAVRWGNTWRIPVAWLREQALIGVTTGVAR